MPNYHIKKKIHSTLASKFSSLPGNRTILQNVKAKFKIDVRKYLIVTHLWIHGMRTRMCVCVCVSQEHPAASGRYHKQGLQKDILRCNILYKSQWMTRQPKTYLVDPTDQRDKTTPQLGGTELNFWWHPVSTTCATRTTHHTVTTRLNAMVHKN
jgi:hypothetical protein